MPNSKDITFYDLWKEYNEYLLLRLKAQSYRKMKSNFKLHILPYFGSFKLNSITHMDYIKWMQNIEKKGFKNAYNKHLHYTMVGIFNYAIKFGYITSNIASLVGCFTKKRNERKNVDFWTLEEYKQFISVVDDKMYKLLFNTLYFTGLRIGECLALNWNDFKQSYLEVNKTLSKEKDENNNYIINSPKTLTSYRNINLDDNLTNSFKELYKEQSKLNNFDNSWFIFGGIKPFSQTTVGRRKNNYCVKANVKKIRLHDFRHSHATLLLSYGANPTVIAQRLGHSDTNITLNTYSHLIPKDIDKAVKIINDIKLKDHLI